MTRFRIAALSALLVLLTTASSALAGGYITGGQDAQGDVASAGSPGGTLPFTGLDLALIVVGGLALLATGLILRRTGRSRKASS